MTRSELFSETKTPEAIERSDWVARQYAPPIALASAHQANGREVEG
jgi:hypothetical protein